MISKYSSKIRYPLVANSFYLYSSHFADYLLSFLILPFIARKLGPESLGQVALAQTFGVFCLLFMEYGFSLTATRKVATLKENKQQLASYVSEAFSFKLCLIPILFIISLAVVWSMPIFQENPHFIFIVFIGSVFQGVAPTWFFQGVERLNQVAFSKVLFRIVGFIFIVLFIKNEKDGWMVLFGQTITSGCILFYLYKQMNKYIGRVHLKYPKNTLALWGENKWGFFITIIPVIYQNLSAFFVGSLVAPLQLGLLFGASKIHRAFNTLYGPLGQAFFPRLVATNESSTNDSKKLLTNLLMIMGGLSLLFAVALILFSESIITILLGVSFLDAMPVLRLFGFVLPLTAISHVIGRQWMLVKKHEKSYGTILCCASIISTLFVWFGASEFNIKVIPISMILFESITIGLIVLYKMSSTSD